MPFFLGIDGGGSKTSCVLGDEQKVIASVVVGPSNIVRVGEAQARSALQQGVAEVCRQAGIAPSQLSAICAGMAGAAREDVRQQVARILAALSPAQLEIVGDMLIAHEAALGGGPGILVLAGTGSMAYGRDQSGRIARAGGWGYAISDEGSGHWIGMQAVVAITRARDRGAASALGARILQRWTLSSHEQLMSVANASPAPDFSALFPEVLASAEAGDCAALDVLSRAGLELAGLAKTVYERLWEDDQPVKVVLMGGVLEHSTVVRDSFYQHLARSFPRAEVSLSTCSPATAALARARKMSAGTQATAEGGRPL